MRKFKILLLFPVLVLLQGCFEVIEEVTYKDAESGTYLMTMNCSQSKTKLKALMKLDTFMGADIPSKDEIYNYFSLAALAVRKTPGISSAYYTADFENFIFTFTFTFDKTETLNKAINAAAVSVTNKSSLPYYNVFRLSKNSFERNKTPNDSIASIIKDKPEHLKLITGAKVTSIYRFQKTVRKVSNPKARISKNKKAVMLQQQITDILSNPALFTNTITF